MSGELHPASEKAGEGLVRHAGGCHCRSVRFEVSGVLHQVLQFHCLGLPVNGCAEGKH